MQISASQPVRFTPVAAGGRRALARGRVAAPGRVAMRVSNRAAGETEEDLGPYGNGYKPYPLPFGGKRVYVWERPPAGVEAAQIFKPRAVPTNHFEQYWYDFLYLYPELPEWQVKLQAWANEVYGAPKYKWAQIYRRLKAKNVKSVTPEEAYKMLNTPSFPFGAKTILLDIREEQRFNKACAGGAVNTPYFDVGIPPTNTPERIRQISYFFLGLQVPTFNPTFIEDVTAACGGKKNTRIIVMCQTGGTLENTEERKKRNPRLPRPPLGDFGQSSRSLMAAHDLIYDGGFTNVVHASGGLGSWKVAGFPMESAGSE